MKGLRCKTPNCEYNLGGHCGAGVINIGKYGGCQTKVKREYGALEQLFNAKASGMEAAEDFDYAKNEDIQIQCQSTNCKYNRFKCCTSPRVTIGNFVMRTKCYTKEIEK